MANKREKKNRINRTKIIIIIASTLVVLIGCFLAPGAFLAKEKIAKNISAGKTDLSGMTLTEAEKVLADDNVYNGISIEITSQGYSTQFTAEDIALTTDAKKTAQKAFDIGKSKNIFKNSCDFYKLIFTTVDIGHIPTANSEKLDSLLYAFGTTFNGEYTDYQITTAKETATITPRIAGQDPNTDQAKTEVLDSIMLGVYKQIAVTLKKAEPLAITIDELYDRVNSVAIDAEYVYNGNEISIKEHAIGIEVERENLTDAVKLLNSNQSATVPIKKVMPSITSDSLQSKLFNATLSSYSTTYSTKASNRASNVALASSRINGKVLKPGETFSYNETIGDTTIENGYKVAPVFENGKTSEGVGGGICQVSSTLYSAVLYADLKVVERRNHSLTVAYVPKGQDATVSYGAINFKFANSTDYPVKIISATNGGTITISLIGTQREVARTVQLKHTIVETIQPTTIEKPDPSLPLNTKKVISTGKSGYVVDTFKTVLENGKQISSDKITRSTYKMIPTEVAVGSGSEAAVYVVPSPAPASSTAVVPTPTQGNGSHNATPSPKPDSLETNVG